MKINHNVVTYTHVVLAGIMVVGVLIVGIATHVKHVKKKSDKSIN